MDKIVEIENLLQEIENTERRKSNKRITLAQKAYDLSVEIDYHSGIAESRHSLAETYIDLCRYDESLEQLWEALDFFLKQKDWSKVAQAYNRIAVNYDFLGNYPIALDYYKNGLEALNNLNNEDYLMKARLLINTSCTYLELEEYEKAIESLKIALKYSKEKVNKGLCYMDIGCAYMNLEQYDTALENLKMGLDLLRDSDYHNGIIGNLIELGRLYQKIGDRDKAADYFLQSLKYIKKKTDGHDYMESETYLGLAELNEVNHKYEEARVCYQKALSLAQKIDAKKLQATIHEDMSKLYEQIGLYKESLEQLKILHGLNNEIFNQDTQQKVNNIKNQHVIEENKKEAQQIEKSFMVLKTISSLGQKLISTFDIEEILMTLYQEINSLMDALVMGILPYDKENQKIVFKLIIEDGEKLPEISIPVKNKKSLASWVIRNRQILHINNFKKEYSKYIVEPIEPLENTPSSIISIPLIINDEAIGVFTVQSYKKNAYNSNDVETLSILSTYIAIAVDNTQRFQAEKEKRLMSESLQELSSLLTSTLEMEEVLNRFLDNLSNIISYHIAIILLKRGNYLQVVAVKGDLIPERISEVEINIKDEAFLEEIVTVCSPLITNKLYISYHYPGLEEINSWFGIPLMYSNQVKGILLLGNKNKDYYRKKDLEFITAFAGQGAIAINNAELFEKVNTLANRDFLTGLYNRRIFFEISRNELEQAKRNHYSIAVIIFDIDHFKDFNDNYGHIAGDRLLKKIADVSLHNVREADTVGRYGGEEFVILAPGADLNEGQMIAESLRLKIEDSYIETHESGRLSVTCSFGVAAGISNLDKLLSKADKALYQAKKKGRNRVEIEE